MSTASPKTNGEIKLAKTIGVFKNKHVGVAASNDVRNCENVFFEKEMQ